MTLRTPLQAPEICEGKQYDAKSDIWAMGIVMYECCMGK